MKKKAFRFNLLPSQKIKILTTQRLLRGLIFIDRCIFLLKCFLQRSQNNPLINTELKFSDKNLFGNNCRSTKVKVLNILFFNIYVKFIHNR